MAVGQGQRRLPSKAGGILEDPRASVLISSWEARLILVLGIEVERKRPQGLLGTLIFLDAFLPSR